MLNILFEIIRMLYTLFMYICVCTNYKVTFIYLLNFVTRGNLNILVDVISIATFIVKTTNFYNAVSQQHTNNNVLVDLIVMFHVKHIIWNNELSTFKAKCFMLSIIIMSCGCIVIYIESYKHMSYFNHGTIFLTVCAITNRLVVFTIEVAMDVTSTNLFKFPRVTKLSK